MKIIDNYFIKLFNNFTINPSMKTQSSILICNNNNKFPKQSKSIILKLNPLIYSLPLNPTDVQDDCVDKIEYPEPEQEEIIQKSLESLDKKIEETLAGKMEQIQEGGMEEGVLETLEKIEDMQKEEASAITIVPQIIGNNLTYNIILDHIKKYHSLYFILGLILFIKHK
jgi:hypothetical protein